MNIFNSVSKAINSVSSAAAEVKTQWKTLSHKDKEACVVAVAQSAVQMVAMGIFFTYAGKRIEHLSPVARNVVGAGIGFIGAGLNFYVFENIEKGLNSKLSAE